MALRPQHVEQKQPYVDDSCKLLLHMNGVSGNQQFIDSSNSPKVVTPYGNACLSNSHYRFGGTSGYISSNTSDKLTLSSTDFTSIKTISFWFYRVGAWSGNPCLFQSGSAAANGYFQYHPTRLAMEYHQPSDAVTGSFGAPSTDVWHHYIATCDGTNATFYVDGAQVNQAAYTGVFFTNSAIQIGNYQSLYPAIGYFDEVMMFDRVVPVGELYPQLRPYGYPIGGT